MRRQGLLIAIREPALNSAITVHHAAAAVVDTIRTRRRADGMRAGRQSGRTAPLSIPVYETAVDSPLNFIAAVC